MPSSGTNIWHMLSYQASALILVSLFCWSVGWLVGNLNIFWVTHLKLFFPMHSSYDLWTRLASNEVRLVIVFPLDPVLSYHPLGDLGLQNSLLGTCWHRVWPYGNAMFRCYAAESISCNLGNLVISMGSETWIVDNVCDLCGRWQGNRRKLLFVSNRMHCTTVLK